MREMWPRDVVAPFCGGPWPVLTSGVAAAAGAAPGIAPPIGMSPTSWIFSVFCREKGQQFKHTHTTSPARPLHLGSRFGHDAPHIERTQGRGQAVIPSEAR